MPEMRQQEGEAAHIFLSDRHFQEELGIYSGNDFTQLDGSGSKGLLFA